MKDILGMMNGSHSGTAITDERAGGAEPLAEEMMI
jgi:hypothetical protein